MIAHYIIKEGLVKKDFIDSYTEMYGDFKAHVIGGEDAGNGIHTFKLFEAIQVLQNSCNQDSDVDGFVPAVGYQLSCSILNCHDPRFELVG